jgi:hypothetical protein
MHELKLASTYVEPGKVENLNNEFSDCLKKLAFYSFECSRVIRFHADYKRRLGV